MNKLWKCILSFLMAALLLPVSPQPIQAETDTFINDFDIGMGIDQVTYIGEWNTDQNYPDLFYGGDDHWIAFETDHFDGALEIVFYGTAIKLYGNLEPMGGIQRVLIDGQEIAEVDAYAPQKQMGVCLFDSAEHVSLAADKHVLRYEPTQTKNEASSGYNMQFDYARASAPQDGELQYAQLRQESMSVEAGEQQQVQLQLFPANADAQVRWESSDPQIAAVDANGMVSGLAEGDCMISAALPQIDAELFCSLSVVPAAADLEETIVNDDEVGTEMFQFSFEGPWVHEGGFPDRFVGGDEHWITSAQFGDALPAYSFRFYGSKVELYGHKVPAGAMADVLIDGELVGTIDYYLPSRAEQQLLFASAEMEEGEHVITVRLNGQSNPSSTGTFEAAVDYAKFYHTEREFYPTAIQLEDSEIMLEEGMTYQPSAKILPAYASVLPEIIWSSSDPQVASADPQSGAVRALRAGEATITARLDGMDIEASFKVEVRPCKERFASMVKDNNLHAYEDEYLTYVEQTYEEGTSGMRSWSGTAWRNDVVTSRIDLLTKAESYEDVTLSSSDFISDSGSVIASEHIAMTFMRSSLAYTNERQITDIITDERVMDLQAQKLYSVWVAINVPEQAQPGEYHGTLRISCDDTVLAEFAYTLHVIDLVQPDAQEDEMQLELWMYPYSSNRYYSGKSTVEYFGDSVEDLYAVHLDPQYQDGLESQLELYRKAGGDAITVTVVEDPWNSQTPDPYPSMVKWIRHSDGTFSFDYTDLDYWVSLNLAHGIDGQIKSFSMSCWGNRITYYDEASGQVVSEAPATGSARWEELWRAFMEDYVAHMEKKGWFDMTYMAMDERPLAEIEPVLDLVESVTNSKGESMKMSLAVYDYGAESIFDRIDDLSLAYQLGSSKVKEIAEHRQELGLLTTMYTCGAQNSALLNEPGEGAYSIYHAAKYGTDGFLRWALDAFNDDPLVSSAHRILAAGDIYLIYPDEKDDAEMQAHSSVRFEKLMEGVRDMAKLKVLREQYPQLEEKVADLLDSIGMNTMPAEVNRVRAEIFRLSEEALYGEIEGGIQIEEGDLRMEQGETRQLHLRYTPAELEQNVRTVTYLNDMDPQITYSGSWIEESGYDDLFYGGDDHYCAPQDGEDAMNHGYSFTFSGDSFAIIGNREPMAGKFDVYIDGEYAATVDPYDSAKLRHQAIYTSPLLENTAHEVQVVGNGEKHAQASGYNMQLDVIETYVHAQVRWTSSDPQIVSVSAAGEIKALRAGTAMISVSYGEYTDSIQVSVATSVSTDDEGQKADDADTAAVSARPLIMLLLSGSAIGLLLMWKKRRSS